MKNARVIHIYTSQEIQVVRPSQDLTAESLLRNQALHLPKRCTPLRHSCLRQIRLRIGKAVPEIQAVKTFKVLYSSSYHLEESQRVFYLDSKHTDVLQMFSRRHEQSKPKTIFCLVHRKKDGYLSIEALFIYLPARIGEFFCTNKLALDDLSTLFMFLFHETKESCHALLFCVVGLFCTFVFFFSFFFGLVGVLPVSLCCWSQSFFSANLDFFTCFCWPSYFLKRQDIIWF